MANENVFLFYALLMGIFITFVYDLLRVFRRVVPHGNFLISLEDIGFWIYCAAKVFLLMYHESDGTLRWFAVLGALVGMTAYKKLVSSFFVKYASLLIKKVLQIMGKVGSILTRPLRVLLTKAKKAAAAAKERALRRKKNKEWFLKKKLTLLLKVLKMVI